MGTNRTACDTRALHCASDFWLSKTRHFDLCESERRTSVNTHVGCHKREACNSYAEPLLSETAYSFNEIIGIKRLKQEHYQFLKISIHKHMFPFFVQVVASTPSSSCSSIRTICILQGICSLDLQCPMSVLKIAAFCK